MLQSITPDSNQTVFPSVIPPREASLETLIQLYTQLKQTEAAVDTAAQSLKTVQERFDDLSRRLIPAVMASLGLTEIRMADGRVLSIKTDYFGSVAQERMPAAVTWLIAHQMDGIIKSDLVVPFAPGRLDALHTAGIPAGLKHTIHSSTLKAFVRERLEAPDHETFPKELFAASAVDRAVLSDNT